MNKQTKQLLSENVAVIIVATALITSFILLNRKTDNN